MQSRTKLLANTKRKLNLFITYLLRASLLYYYMLYSNTKVKLFFNNTRKTEML